MRRGELPDVRDGLTKTQRTVLMCLRELQAERPGRYVSVAQLFGRVNEYVNVTERQLVALLRSLGAGS